MVCVSGVKQKWSVCNLKNSGRYAACLHWTQNKAPSHINSGFGVALWPNEPNETFTQWKIEPAPFQLACIKIPHCLSSFSQNPFFFFFGFVFVANWVDFSFSLFDVGLQRTYYRAGCFDQFCSCVTCICQDWLNLLFSLCVLKGCLFRMCHSQKSSIHAHS